MPLYGISPERGTFSQTTHLHNHLYKITHVMSALKNHPRGERTGICGGVGCAHTYTSPPLAVDLFSVDSCYEIVYN
jgi:hypothetical protein